MVRLNVSCTLVPTASLNCPRMNQIHRESASLLVPCQGGWYKEVTTAYAAEKDSWCMAKASHLVEEALGHVAGHHRGLGVLALLLPTPIHHAERMSD
jgi:hypothetical protein